MLRFYNVFGTVLREHLKRIIAAILLLLVTNFCYARLSVSDHFERKRPTGGPWFTGPLLTPSGHIVPQGHINYEPYIYWTQYQAIYDSNWHVHSVPMFTNVLFQGSMQFGIFKDTEFDIAPQVEFNQKQNQRLSRVSDLPLTLAFQLYTNENYALAIKLRFAANVPLGKYDQLSPTRLDTDIGGVGTWYPGIGLVFSKLFQINQINYLSTRLFFTYNFGTPVEVRGMSIYGGAPSSPGTNGTRGTVYPGNVFLFLNSYEYSFTPNWVLALDLQYQHTDNIRFSGTSPPGTRPVWPSQELYALALGVEYNWNQDVGVILGPWFTVAGRNTAKFISYVAALNIYV